MNAKTVVWIAIAALVAVVAFLAFRPAAGGVENVDAAQAAELAGQPNMQIIDVRTLGEFQMGHIPGAVNVPVDTLSTRAEQWDRSATYLVYCATGARSATAVGTMQSMGFQNIKHFNAGIQAWGGKLDTGGASSNTKVETSGKPVMIEFFTDS